MTDSQIEQPSKSGYLKLNFTQWVGHFFLVILSIILPIIFVFNLVFPLEQGPVSHSVEENLVVLGISSVVSLLLYLARRGGLKLTLIHTDLSSHKIREILISLASVQKWRIDRLDEKVFIAKSQSEPHTAEHITVLFSHKGLLVNSIDDPDHKHPGITTAINQEHVWQIFNKIRQAEKNLLA